MGKKDSFGALYVDLEGRMSKLEGDLKKAKSKSSKAGQEAGKGFGTGFKNALAAVGITAGITVIVNALKTWTKAALRQRVAEAKVTQAVRQTGMAAGFSAKQIFKMASNLQKITAIADEAVLQDVAGQLLTFTNITGRSFERAIKSVLDLNAVINTGSYASLASQSIQLGKALEDPIRGMTALRRSGVTFSAEQEKMVKKFVEQNNLMGAQAIILDEIEAKYGGQAEALSRAQGNIDDMSEAWGDFQEILGEVFLPTLDDVAGGLVKIMRFLSPFKKDISDQQAELNGLAGALLDTTEGTREYDTILNEINRRFPDFLKNLSEEKTLHEQIAERLKLSNEQMLLRAQISAVQDKLAQGNKELADATADYMSSLITVNRIFKQYLPNIDSTTMSLQEQYQMLKELQNTMPVYSREYKELGVQMNVVDGVMVSSKDSMNIYAQAIQETTGMLNQLNQQMLTVTGTLDGLKGDGQDGGMVQIGGIIAPEDLEGDLDYVQDIIDEHLKGRKKIKEGNDILSSGLESGVGATFSEVFGGMVDDMRQSSSEITRIAGSMVDAILSQLARLTTIKLISLIPGMGFLGMLQHGGSFSGSPKSVRRMAGGGSFNVPFGYQNDSYPLLVESGERVDVTSRGRTSMQESLLKEMIGRIEALNMNIAEGQGNKSQNINIGVSGKIEGHDIKMSYDKSDKLAERYK